MWWQDSANPRPADGAQISDNPVHVYIPDILEHFSPFSLVFVGHTI